MALECTIIMHPVRSSKLSLLFDFLIFEIRASVSVFSLLCYFQTSLNRCQVLIKFFIISGVSGVVRARELEEREKDDH